MRTDESYQEGYETAKKIIFELEHPTDKISEYIELLNQGYIPKYEDKETKFSNGEPINQFWSSRNNKEKIKERLRTNERYLEGYEIAKEIIFELEHPINKISEYIELLNQGYVPKSFDAKTKLSNGEPINYFWTSGNNKEKIIKELFEIQKSNLIYAKAREIILKYFKVNTIEEYYELEQKKKQLKELKNIKQNLENVDNSLEINETISRKRA